MHDAEEPPDYEDDDSVEGADDVLPDFEADDEPGPETHAPKEASHSPHAAGATVGTTKVVAPVRSARAVLVETLHSSKGHRNVGDHLPALDGDDIGGESSTAPPPAPRKRKRGGETSEEAQARLSQEALPSEADGEIWVELLRDSHVRQLREASEHPEPPVFPRMAKWARNLPPFPVDRFPPEGLLLQHNHLWASRNDDRGWSKEYHWKTGGNWQQGNSQGRRHQRATPDAAAQMAAFMVAAAPLAKTPAAQAMLPSLFAQVQAQGGSRESLMAAATALAAQSIPPGQSSSAGQPHK